MDQSEAHVSTHKITSDWSRLARPSMTSIEVYVIECASIFGSVRISSESKFADTLSAKAAIVQPGDIGNGTYLRHG